MTSVNWNNKLSSEFSSYILPQASSSEMYFFLFFLKPSPSFKCDSFSCYSCLFGSTDSLVGVWTENSPALKIQGAALVGSFFFRHRWYNPWILHGAQWFIIWGRILLLLKVFTVKYENNSLILHSYLPKICAVVSLIDQPSALLDAVAFGCSKRWRPCCINGSPSVVRGHCVFI